MHALLRFDKRIQFRVVRVVQLRHAIDNERGMKLAKGSHDHVQNRRGRSPDQTGNQARHILYELSLLGDIEDRVTYHPGIERTVSPHPALLQGTLTLGLLAKMISQASFL